MTKYNCTVIFDASASLTVEADTPEDAATQAEDETQGRQNLCHQCSNDLETGDSIGVLVYNDECTEELLDTRYKTQRTWIGLTDTDIRDGYNNVEWTHAPSAHWFEAGVKFCEAKLKEKNA